MPTTKTKETVEQETKVVDLPIFEGGPLESSVEGWKKQYGTVYMTEVDADTAYIWRVLLRSEFRALMANEDDDLLSREDRICDTCVLWPQKPSLAGVPTILSQQIMDKSGFIAKGGPVKL
jgi:hypothetical protein